MARTPEFGQGEEPVSPRTTKRRKEIVCRQRSGSLREFAEHFEGEKHPPKIQNNPGFPQADPVKIYRVSGLVNIKGYQFPEGVLPINAIPIGEINFFSRLLLKFGLNRQPR